MIAPIRLLRETGSAGADTLTSPLTLVMQCDGEPHTHVLSRFTESHLLGREVRDARGATASVQKSVIRR